MKEPAVTNGSIVNNEPHYVRRLIEVDLPIKRISEHARREKSIRHGHISTLHIWWARRPLAACRAVICAALWPDPADPLCPQDFRDSASRLINEFARNAVTNRELAEHCSKESWIKWQSLSASGGLDGTREAHWNILRFALLDFIADFANWDNSSVADYLRTSRALSHAAHEALGGTRGTKPLVVDPFAGGGSIPLEALRVGADAFASDLNPVAVLLNKVLLEYIPRFGKRLAEEVTKWGAWVEEQAVKELAEFYPKDPDGSVPIAYLWARTINCLGPNCGVEVPIFQSGDLVKLGKRKLGLVLKSDRKAWRYEIHEDTGKGTASRGSVTCPCCGFTTPIAEVRRQLKRKGGGTSDASLMAVVLENPTSVGRSYRLAREEDLRAVRKASEKLEQIVSQQHHNIPTIELPFMSGVFNVPIYGMDRWDLLFTPRQRIFLSTLARNVRAVADIFPDSELREAVVTCLALAVGKCADFHSSLAAWIPVGEKIGHTFGRQALGMIWDYAEGVPFVDFSGSWQRCIGYITKVIDANTIAESPGGVVVQAAAQDPVLPMDSAQLVVTDPPYYNAVPFADLSDFFYVWFSSILSTVHPGLFPSQTSPKDKEIAELSGWDDRRYSHKDRDYFHREFRDAMTRAREMTVPDGLAVVFFAHKSTSGWEATLEGLIDAGWVISASWPLDTERAGRLRAMNSAVLASSVQLVCRPRQKPDGSVRTDEVGDWRDVLSELPKRMHQWMPRLANEGVVGADSIFACLGPALEIFSRYERVEKASGEQVTLKEYLEYVWAAVAREALNMIFEGADATGFEEDARLTAMWLWTLSTGLNGDGDLDDAEVEEDEDSGKKAKMSGFVLEYDAARKIAQGLGAHLERLTSLIEIRGDKARLLPVGERAQHLFGKDEGAAPTKRRARLKQLSFADVLVDAEEEEGGWGEKNAPRAGITVLDRIHQSMILFAAGRGEALKRFLVLDGAGQDPRFWRLAQALSALYPTGSEERRWVEGVLARKKSLGF